MEVLDFPDSTRDWYFVRSNWYGLMNVKITRKYVSIVVQDIWGESCFEIIRLAEERKFSACELLSARLTVCVKRIGLQLVCLTVAPAFIAGGIYLTLKQ